jgi:hypothetical protein
MYRTQQVQFFSFCAATLVCAASLASAQQKYQLQNHYAVGDTGDTQSTMDMKLEISVDINGHKYPPMPYSSRQTEGYRQTVLGVDTAGKLAAIKRSYVAAHEVETDSDGKSKTTASSLEGKTVTVRRVDGKVQVTSAAAIADKDRKDLMDALDNSSDEIFPKRGIAIGEEWTVESKSLARSLGGADKATVKVKLQEVGPHAGYRCAHLKLNIDVVSHVPNSKMQMTMQLVGDAYQALDIDKPVTFDMSGPITIKGSEKEGDQISTYNGHGTMSVHEAVKWFPDVVKAKSPTEAPVVQP